MKRILITGVSGFLGRYVASSLKRRYAVLGTYHRHATDLDGCESARLDVTDQTAVRTLLTSVLRADFAERFRSRRFSLCRIALAAFRLLGITRALEQSPRCATFFAKGRV